MISPSVSNTRRVKSIAAIRSIVDDKVARRAEILGSMIGPKIRNGQSTGHVGITYLVRWKIPKSEISPSKRVPSRVLVDDVTVITDVLAWPKIVEQSLPTPTIIYDDRRQGSLSCFAATSEGYFGLSCAHCLAGSDRNPATTSDIYFWGGTTVRWVGAGKSAYLAYSPGRGTSGNYGYLDCGIFDLRDEQLSSRAASGTPLSTVRDLHSLLNKTLVAISTLNPSPSKLRRAKVVGVEQSSLDELSDLVLEVEAPGTFHGDSGMLWLTESGRAAAVHARGEIMAGGNGSRLTTAMSAARVCDSLGIKLVIG